MNDDVFDHVADAILDGTSIDWAAVESAAGQDRHALLNRLRVLSALADVHRDPAPLSSAALEERLADGDEDGTKLRQWGHLRLVEAVGSGSFGEVYRARDTRLDRDVALKLLPASPSGDIRASSIIEEGRLLAQVRHPNVVTIHGAERIGERIGLWMEFVKGRTLEQLLEEGKRFSVDETIEIGIQLCLATSAVHGAGLLHRDIKAQNVMLADDGRVVLMDFGTGWEISDNSRADPAGTPLYLAPELLAGKEATVRSDIYSIGVLLFHLLTGVYPVGGQGIHELRRAHDRHARVDLRSVRPDASRELARIIERAIDSRPEQRYESGAAMAEHLRASQKRVPRRAWSALAALALVATLLVGLSNFSFTRYRETGPFHTLTVAPFTTFPGQEVAPTFSPDGSQVAFAWSPEGLRDQFDLHVKGVGTEQTLQLTTHPADFIFPAWSPDGRQIAFARTADEGSGIYLVAPHGGGERKLADGRFPYFLQSILSWSPDGKSIAFHDKGPSGRFGISVLNVETLEREWRGSPSADCVWAWVPVFSPDSQSLAVACMVSGGVNDLYVLPAPGGAGRRIAHLQGTFAGMVWTPDSADVLYAVNGELWRVPREGGEPEKVLIGPDVGMPAISSDGRRLAYTQDNFGTVNLWQVSLATRTQPDGPPVRLVASSMRQDRPAFSHDGRRLAFNSTRSGTLEIWTANADGSNATRLTAFGGPWTGSPRWSPDDSLIAFDSHGADRSKIYLVRHDGGAVSPVATGVDDSSTPAWSVDGKWLYFSGSLGGTLQIFKVPREGGAAMQLTRGGGQGPIAATSDDTRIYYSLGGSALTKDTTICSVSTTGRDEKCLSGRLVVRPEYFESWALHPEGLYFVSADTHRPGIDFFDFASTRTTRVVDLPGRPARWSGTMALSPDGRRLLYSQLDGIASDIMLVDNFR